jgi:hypothetical protein
MICEVVSLNWRVSESKKPLNLLVRQEEGGYERESRVVSMMMTLMGSEIVYRNLLMRINIEKHTHKRR